MSSASVAPTEPDRYEVVVQLGHSPNVQHLLGTCTTYTAFISPAYIPLSSLVSKLLAWRKFSKPMVDAWIDAVGKVGCSRCKKRNITCVRAVDSSTAVRCQGCVDNPTRDGCSRMFECKVWATQEALNVSRKSAEILLTWVRVLLFLIAFLSKLITILQSSGEGKDATLRHNSSVAPFTSAPASTPKKRSLAAVDSEATPSTSLSTQANTNLAKRTRVSDKRVTQPAAPLVDKTITVPNKSQTRSEDNCNPGNGTALSSPEQLSSTVHILASDVSHANQLRDIHLAISQTYADLASAEARAQAAEKESATLRDEIATLKEDMNSSMEERVSECLEIEIKRRIGVKIKNFKKDLDNKGMKAAIAKLRA
jgi:hypothetical protein